MSHTHTECIVGKLYCLWHCAWNWKWPWNVKVLAYPCCSSILTVLFSGQTSQWNNPKPSAVHSKTIHTWINLIIPCLIQSYLTDKLQMSDSQCIIAAWSDSPLHIAVLQLVTTLLIACLYRSVRIMSKEFRCSDHWSLFHLNIKSMWRTKWQASKQCSDCVEGHTLLHVFSQSSIWSDLLWVKFLWGDIVIHCSPIRIR